MLAGVDIHRLVETAMDGEVGLPVAVQVELPDLDWSRHRCLVDGSGHRLIAPLDLTGQAHVDRQHSHMISSFRMEWNPGNSTPAWQPEFPGPQAPVPPDC